MFYDLSEDILTAITRELMTETKSPWLIKVRLVATREHLDTLAAVDNTKRIAPFVRSLTFVAPPNSWTLTPEGFKEIIITQVIQKYAADHAISTGMSSFTHEENGHQKFIDEHWGGKPPFSEEHIRQGFERYHEEALKSKDLLMGEGLKAAWTRIL
ncbi:hypothetical protein LTR37_016585 [Vermiconidia calcicola]|uniref:Uncharacterized protein n=1 Tax=Vermiconidia calcicola TaxID=1690605 RepID=A0ACC3MN18_9PEZI|nr:hypothetical protein LTR37_016585 [Vermiconidia calcicola]